MKTVFLFFVLTSFSLNAQHYKGLNISKEQKLQLKNICKEHSKVCDSIKLNHKKQVQKLKFKNSEEHYNLNQLYIKKKDSIESDVDNKMANVLDETQRKVFWERIQLEKKKRAEHAGY